MCMLIVNKSATSYGFADRVPERIYSLTTQFEIRLKNKKAGKKSVSNAIRAFSETFQVFQLSSVS